MSKNEKCALAVCAAILSILLFAAISPVGRAWWNTHFYFVQKADDATSYRTKKEVEDTCRAMIASYEADRLAWEQYKESYSEERRSWADQAKMRANKTAASYNQYVLKNSFVFSGNIPQDIYSELEYIN